jgi:hypothetical protein
MKKLIAALALTSACASWRPSHYAAEGAFVAVTLLDWSQTRGITHDCIESNPIIGKCGERAPLAFYFPVTLALHWAVSALLPARARGWWQGVSLGVESEVVVTNWMGGYQP